MAVKNKLDKKNGGGYVEVVLDTEKIKSRRKELGLSMQEASVIAGGKIRQWWSNIENGHQKNLQLDTLNSIARALQMPARELLK